MRIEEIDQNLAVETEITEPDIIWLDVKQAPFMVYGVRYDALRRRYVRMPQEIAERVSEGVAGLNFHTAGGRVRFQTDSDFIGIRAVMENGELMSHIPLTGQSGFDLYRKKERTEKEQYVQSFIPPMGMKTGYSSSARTDGVMAEYTIHFPLYDGVKELYVALKKGAVLQKPEPYLYEKPIVYYGSSITQGGCASRPGNSYQAIISRMLQTDYINLGFSGSCRAEQQMLDYLAGLDMSIFVCDYDHNAPDAAYLQRTHLPLYRAIRAAQPELPIVMVSSPNILDSPEFFTERREIIRNTCQTAWKEGDQKLYFVDGAELFAGENWDSCTVDKTHPNDLGFYRMAMCIGEKLQQVQAAF